MNTIDKNDLRCCHKRCSEPATGNNTLGDMPVCDKHFIPFTTPSALVRLMYVSQPHLMRVQWEETKPVKVRGERKTSTGRMLRLV